MQSLGDQSGSLLDSAMNISLVNIVDSNSCLRKNTYDSVPWIFGGTEASSSLHFQERLILYTKFVIFNNKKREMSIEQAIKQTLYYRV